MEVLVSGSIKKFAAKITLSVRNFSTYSESALLLINIFFYTGMLGKSHHGDVFSSAKYENLLDFLYTNACIIHNFVF